MVRIELTPTLDHCIETTARQEFSKAANQYMQRGAQDEELEEKIELLRAFLESMDFKELRRGSEKHLIEGKTVRFILYLEEGKPRYEMKVGK
ncbi:MAG: hypothetical protein KAT75_08025 [Dehalococcoidia bacterium]|nr:hypothetical protein [Dehalococcoidia bacterium]